MRKLNDIDEIRRNKTSENIKQNYMNGRMEETRKFAN